MTSYTAMFTAISSCDNVNVSISQIEDYVKEAIQKLKKMVTPTLAMCLCFVQGMLFVKLGMAKWIPTVFVVKVPQLMQRTHWCGTGTEGAGVY